MSFIFSNNEIKNMIPTHINYVYFLDLNYFIDNYAMRGNMSMNIFVNEWALKWWALD